MRKASLSDPTVAIVGAGPYGVSVAAHLDSAGIDLRIFGKPIHRWQHQMPKGMFLKSEGGASNLSDPTGQYTLKQYCSEEGLSYGDRVLPVSLEVFTDYALWFQRNLVPAIEEVMVTAIEKTGDNFRVRLADGSHFSAAKVIVATGLDHADHVPVELATLPPELLSHSNQHHDLTRFRGQDVTVIGGGQSALETAALLVEQGASVRVVVRKPALVWNETPTKTTKSLYGRFRRPSSGLGDGLELWLSCEAPHLWRKLPERVRLKRYKSVLGPAGAWWLKERVVEHVPVLLGHSVVKAKASQGSAALHLAGPDGRVIEHVTNHVIAATGYRFDLRRLPFLSPGLKSQVRSVQRLPVLSSGFESSVRGLHFVGLASASSFGPVMRFLVGSRFTARHLTHHIVSGGRPRWSPHVPELAETK